ncbi:copper amine oxidase N-terminal domain-containing protein [Wukongibacter sp. M2B1]|uniref:copper amine oxidase N-terminal domain-containing protein n=1 Tax=Wukongibacter sp. M2B1 TaxID=3088895 RepID=UPI003D79787E
MDSKRKGITKKIITALAIVLLMGFSVSVGVGYSKEITAWFYDIKVKLDGKPLSFSKKPFIYDGSVYIPLRDVSTNLGLKVDWDENTKTVYLVSNDVDNADPNYSIQYNIDNGKNTDDIEDKLNKKYGTYTKGRDDLEFEYDVTAQLTFTKIKMNGESFTKDSRSWGKRDKSNFKDFIEEIMNMAAMNLNKDVKIYVEDRYGKTIGKYEYVKDKEEFRAILEYESDADEDMVIEAIEDYIRDEYGNYREGSEDLSFSYNLSKRSDYITIDMKGRFKRDSSSWEKREENKFKDFVREVAKEVYDEIEDMDVRICIEDEEKKNLAEYRYNEGKDEFEVIYVYPED